MTDFDSSRIQWQKRWQAVSPREATEFEAEIHQETGEGHVLFGRTVVAVGRRQDCDDVLFYLGISAPRFAVVHLTCQREARPDWPSTSLFESFAPWTKQRMALDAKNF